MTFRTRLFVLFAAAVVTTVIVAAWAVLATTRRAFERLESQRVDAAVAQFRREFERRREEIAGRVERIARADSTLNIAIGISRPDADYSPYVNEAPALAAAHGLDLLELVAEDGTILSSAQWPARFGYKAEAVARAAEAGEQRAFLLREELPEDRVALGLVAVRAVSAGDRKLYVAGGEQLDAGFVESISVPAGMRVLLYRNLAPEFSPALLGATGAAKLRPLIDRVRRTRAEGTDTVRWTSGDATTEAFHAFPLTGRQGDLLGVLLVGSSARERAELERFLLRTAVFVGCGGIMLALFAAWWATARVTRPVRELAAGASEVAAGNWKAHVAVHSTDEIGQLAVAFNHMTRQLAEQRDRLVQAERVAAWRELARRLAHELKNPLFPLQITVENLQRARALGQAEFDEVFAESTGTLLAELENLKRIIARFSDFAKMPRPQLETVDLNALARGTMKLFEAQLAAAGVTASLELDEKLPAVEADPEQMTRVLKNLVLNAVDAMPGGGRVTVRTSRRNGCGAARGRGYRAGPDARGMRAPLHAVLHEQDARHRAGARHRAVRGERPRREHIGRKRAGPGRDVPDRPGGQPRGVAAICAASSSAASRSRSEAKRWRRPR